MWLYLISDLHTVFVSADLVSNGMTPMTDGTGVYTLLSDGASHTLINIDAHCDIETDAVGETIKLHT